MNYSWIKIREDRREILGVHVHVRFLEFNLTPTSSDNSTIVESWFHILPHYITKTQVLKGFGGDSNPPPSLQYH